MTFSDALKLVRENADNYFIISGFKFGDKFYFVTVSSKAVYESGEYVETIYVVDTNDSSVTFDNLINICGSFNDATANEFIEAANNSTRVDS